MVTSSSLLQRACSNFVEQALLPFPPSLIFSASLELLDCQAWVTTFKFFASIKSWTGRLGLVSWSTLISSRSTSSWRSRRGSMWLDMFRRKYIYIYTNRRGKRKVILGPAGRTRSTRPAGKNYNPVSSGIAILHQNKPFLARLLLIITSTEKKAKISILWGALCTYAWTVNCLQCILVAAELTEEGRSTRA